MAHCWLRTSSSGEHVYGLHNDSSPVREHGFSSLREERVLRDVIALAYVRALLVGATW